MGGQAVVLEVDTVDLSSSLVLMEVLEDQAAQTQRQDVQPMHHEDIVNNRSCHHICHKTVANPVRRSEHDFQDGIMCEDKEQEEDKTQLTVIRIWSSYQ